MLHSRRAFLQRGYYDQMAAAAVTAVSGVLRGAVPSAGAEAHVADLGCGEGFFTAPLKAALPGAVLYGVDISRPGIKMAASRRRDIHWIVASLHRSPFLPASLDVALSVFAPIDTADLRRVIRDDGALVTVTPGPDHLHELRSIIYSTV
jgi:23S rRNA (guanine745-N1)-methyltransferase